MNESREVITVLQYIGGLGLGGTQSFVMDLYRAIDKKKIQFDFIVNKGERNSPYYNEILAMGGKIYECPKFKGSNFLTFIKWWNSFFSKHKEYKILHSHIRGSASIFLPIAHKYKITNIEHSHSTSNGTGMKAFIKDVMQLPVRYEADYLFACSEKAGEWLYGKNVKNRRNFYVIRNSIDASKYAYSIDKRNQVKRKLGINNEFVVGFVGRVMQPKNPLFAIEVFYSFHNMVPDSKMLFVGDGNMLDDVKQKAKEFDIEQNIIFTGAREDVNDLLQAMDCYIFPSLWEGLGISLVEAQASGLRSYCSENIPDEAIVTDLVKRIRISSGAQVWAETIKKGMHYVRRVTTENIIKARYDVKQNASFMTAFYKKISNNSRNNR